MSRNRTFTAASLWLGRLALCLCPLVAAAESNQAALFSDVDSPTARVVITRNLNATHAFLPNPPALKSMVDQGLTTLTGKETAREAWLSLASTQDVIGIKVFSLPGANSGTRPEVAAAVIESLLHAGFPPLHLILWDKKKLDLENAGFVQLASKYGIRAEGSADIGYDPESFYESSLLGNLVFGDTEFGHDDPAAGRKSFVSKLVTRHITRIVNIPPLLNHNYAGVTGTLYSLAIASVDNGLRFENAAERLAVAVPEIYALPEIGDRVVLNIIDALVCQYQGQQRSLLHYAIPLNELRFTIDPVAADVLSLAELENQRKLAKVAPVNSNMELYRNASLLQLGVSDPPSIRVETVSE